MKILTGYLAPSAGPARDRRPRRRPRPHRRRRTPRLPARKRAALPRYDAARAAPLLRPRPRARRGARLQQRLDAVIAPLRPRSRDRKAHPANSPKAIASASAWRRCCSTSPTSSSWTSPPAASTPTRSARCASTIREIGRNKTILLSTHILQEVEAMADRVIFINRGRIVFDGTPAEMQAGWPSLDEAFQRAHRGRTHAPASRVVRAIVRARAVVLLQHPHRLRLHHPLHLPQRRRRLLAGALLRHQPRQSRSAQPLVPLPAGLPRSGHQHEPLGGGEEAGHRGAPPHPARHRCPDRPRQVLRRAGHLYRRRCSSPSATCSCCAGWAIPIPA